MLEFSQKAGTYHANAVVQRDSADSLAEWLPATATAGACLEFGAGTGLLTRHLLTCFSRVEASDIAPGMVAEGAQNLPAARWTLRDAFVPQPDPAATWACVASCSMLQWAPDPVAVIKNWIRLLLPGGRLLLGVYVSPSLTELAALLPPGRRFAWRGETVWLDALAAAGARVLRADSITRVYRYPSARVFLRCLHDTGVKIPGQPLTVGQMRRLLQDYDLTADPALGVASTWTSLRIEAEAA
jgi:malonyl-CoA O-methyltransferase